jgi:hypothetical protein
MLLGSARYDIVCARSGDDWIDAGGAADYVFAEAGNDRVYTRDGHRDVIVCGDGLDLAVVDSTDRPRSDCERVRRPLVQLELVLVGARVNLLQIEDFIDILARLGKLDARIPVDPAVHVRLPGVVRR